MPHSSGTNPASLLALPQVRSIGLLRPFGWLGLAARDIARAPLLSLAHGLFLAVLGAVILSFGHNRFWFVAGTLSGFLIVGPMLATSLYAISRALERGERVGLGLVWQTWLSWQRSHSGQAQQQGYWSLVRFGLLLSLAGTGWVVISASLIYTMSEVPVDTPMDFVRHVVLARDGALFAIWLALGSFLAAPIFASSVIAMPLLLDRRISVRRAVLTSWAAVLANPVPMALWAAVIVVVTLLGLGTWLIGLVVAMPLLGHASWHAYRELVDASAFAPLDAPAP